MQVTTGGMPFLLPRARVDLFAILNVLRRHRHHRRLRYRQSRRSPK